MSANPAVSGAPIDRVRTVVPAELSDDERARWLELLASEPAFANPFLHPVFAEAVARARGSGVEVAVLERGGDTVGFFAFQRTGGGRRAVPAGGEMADVQAIVVEPGTPWEAEALLEACGLDLLEYDHLLAEQAPFAAGHAYEDDAPTIDLADGFDAYREGIEATGSSVFRQIDRKRRKLAREVGPIEFDFRAEGSEPLEVLVAWKRRRVREQGFRDPLGEPWIGRLVREVGERRVRGFEGVVSVLSAGGRPVAAHLGVLGARVLASWIPAYDPELGRYSPGSILHAELCRAAAEEGIARLDLGRGENRLKERLSTGAVRLAVGAVDRRPLRRVVRSGRAWLRTAILTTPVGDPLRRGVRWIRSRARTR